MHYVKPEKREKKKKITRVQEKVPSFIPLLV